MVFKPYAPELEKVRVIKYVLGIIPLGVQFCEISIGDKDFLLEQFKCS